jgi:hypothetical protein
LLAGITGSVDSSAGLGARARSRNLQQCRARKLGLILRAASAISAPSRQQDFVLSLPDKGFCKLIRAAGTWVPKMGRVISARNHRALRPTQ